MCNICTSFESQLYITNILIKIYIINSSTTSGVTVLNHEIPSLLSFQIGPTRPKNPWPGHGLIPRPEIPTPVKRSLLPFVKRDVVVVGGLYGGSQTVAEGNRWRGERWGPGQEEVVREWVMGGAQHIISVSRVLSDSLPVMSERVVRSWPISVFLTLLPFPFSVFPY